METDNNMCIKKKAFKVEDLSPLKWLNKTIDFTPDIPWFEKGEKVILNFPMQDADFRKNMTTGEIDPEAVKLFNELNGQEVEIVNIDKTERGEFIGLAAAAKPTYVTIRFEDGQEWKETPVTWLEKKEGKEVKSNLEENRYAVERISDLLDAGFGQEEIIDVVCNEYDYEPYDVEEFLREVTAVSRNIEAIKLAKAMQAAIKEAEEELK